MVTADIKNETEQKFKKYKEHKTKMKYLERKQLSSDNNNNNNHCY